MHRLWVNVEQPVSNKADLFSEPEHGTQPADVVRGTEAAGAALAGLVSSRRNELPQPDAAGAGCDPCTSSGSA